MKYCNFCKKETEHSIIRKEKNKDGTGGELKCSICGSVRLDKIQGFDASLM